MGLVAAALLTGGAAWGGLGEWVEHLRGEGAVGRVFTRPMRLPYGLVDGRRPPSETRPELTRLIAAAPRDAELRRLRASEAELASRRIRPKASSL
jgi:hypothetical protein